MKEIQAKNVLDGGQLPERKTRKAAAYDVSVSENFLLHKGRNKVPLGIRIQPPSGYEILIDSRSGFSVDGMEAYHTSDTKFKRPLCIDADVIQGKGDEDYTGIYNVIVKSNEEQSYVLKKGTRIAQMTFVKVSHPEFVVVDSLEATERGDGGFGHTGTNDDKL